MAMSCCIVTGSEEHPVAILARATGEHGGPGKLTNALGLDGRFDAWFADRETRLRMKERRPVPACAYRRGNAAHRRGVCRPDVGTEAVLVITPNGRQCIPTQTAEGLKKKKPPEKGRLVSVGPP